MNNVAINDYFENVDEYFTRQEIETEDYEKRFNEIFKKSYGINPVDCNKDIWNFKSYFPKRKSELNISFKNIPDQWKPVMKKYAVNLLAAKKSVSVTNGLVGMANSIFHDSFEVSTIDTISGYIGQDSLVNKLETTGNKSNYRQQLYYTAINLLQYLSTKYHITFAVDMNYLSVRYQELGQLSLRDRERTPRIPSEYLEIIIERFSEVARTFNRPLDDRMLSAAMVLESQVGLRFEDLLLLKKSDYVEKKYGNTTFAYLEYDTIKPSSDKNNPIKGRTSLNPLSSEMYHIMLKLQELNGVPEDYPYLIWLNLRQHNNTKYPSIVPDTFTYRIQLLFDTYLHEECRKPWPGIRETHLKYSNEPVYIPVLKSYRVNMCDYLSHLGLPSEIIRMKMGHKSAQMDGYYARQDKDNQVERIDASSKFLKTLISENISPIGLNSDTLKQKLELFIKKKEINIYDDKDLENLASEGLIIRSKHCGFCVRVGISCKDDLRTNKILCALDVCPNIYSFYYNLSASLEAFDDAVNALKINKKNGYEKAENLEGSKAADIVSNRILPQIEQLKERQKTLGTEQVLDLHPELRKTISELPEIEERIIKWKKKNMHYFCAT